MSFTRPYGGLSRSTLSIRTLVPFFMLLVVVCGTFNSITGKIRAVALGEYSGVVSNCVGEIVYFIVYATLCAIMALLGRVPREQLAWILLPNQTSHRGMRRFITWFPNIKFAAISALCEVTADFLIFSTQGGMGIVMYKLLQQFIVPSTMLWSVIILRTSYILQELLAVVIVLSIAVISIILQCSDVKNTESTKLLSYLLFSMAMVIQAGAFVVKELMFVEYNKYARSRSFEKQDLNVFLMSSSVHFIGMMAVLPISLLIETFLGQTNVVESLTEGMTLLVVDSVARNAFICYMIVNVLFNISLYYLLATASSTLAFLCATLTLPLSAIMSLINWPIIGSSEVPWFQWIALLAMFIGVVLFKTGNRIKEGLQDRPDCRRPRVCCWPLSDKISSCRPVAQ